MTDERLCANAECGLPLAQKRAETMKSFLRRRSCNPHCGSKAGHQKHLAIYGAHKGVSASGGEARSRDGSEPRWPRVTGEFTGSFAGMDIATGDGGFRRLERPDSRSYVGCAAARCAE